MDKYQKLKKQFNEETIQKDSSFDENIYKSYLEKLSFLENVKKVQDIDNFNNFKPRSYLKTIEKLPIKLKRDDVFDIVLANSKLDEQISQSEQVLTNLHKRLNDLNTEINKQKELKNDLSYLILHINDEVEIQDDVEDQIAIESLRFKKLEQILTELNKKYL